MNRRIFGVLALASALTLGAATAQAVDVTGAGASFVYPVMSRWAAGYAEKTGHRVNYQSIGSGGGIAQIKAGTVDFGASDAPMDEAELEAFGLGQFPDVIGGIVPVVNLPGMAAGELVLDGPTLAAIFLGRVARWDDAAIAALNPGLELPDAAIVVVRRADGSGTTFNFTNYLSKVSPQWKESVGEGTAVKWPTGMGGKGNEGVSAYVKQIVHSLGYVEYAYARQNDLSHVRMKNAAGRVVAPDAASFQAAAATADWAGTRHFNLIMTDAPGAAAWPITATSWVIMHREPRSRERAEVALDFFRYAYGEGREAAAALDYVPLPEALVEQIVAYWASEFPY